MRFYRTLVMSIALGFSVSVLAANSSTNTSPNISPDTSFTPSSSIANGTIIAKPSAPEISPDVRRFSNAVSEIKAYYVETPDDKKIFDNALRGMLEGLDPHSAYLNEEEYAELMSNTTGEFGGLGIEVTGAEEGFIKVISAIDGTPAARAGVKSGDIIVKIDNTPVKGLSLNEAVKRMRGTKGSHIHLLLVRRGEKAPLNLDMVRDIIRIKSVKSELIEPGIGYVRISMFQAPSAQDVQTAVKTLEKQSGGLLKGLILDLRNNPGGLLDSAIDIADIFLDSDHLAYNKLIVYTQGRLASEQVKARATPGDILRGAPIVVLINEGSASASEIVAGALQDHARAVIVGKKSFGKGSVQTILPLDDKTAIKLTTARYYTPGGRSIQAKGIEPDIDVAAITIPDTKSDEEKAMLEAIKEVDLNNHLINDKEKNNSAVQNKMTNNKPAPTLADIHAKEATLLHTDYQLYQAVNVLKGISIAHQNSFIPASQPNVAIEVTKQ